MKFALILVAGFCVSMVGLTVSEARAAAQEPVTLRVISSMATRPVLLELFADFETQSGYTVELESTGGVTAAKRVEDGEKFDVIILASNAIDKLIASGKIVDGSKAGVVNSEVAAAVRKGAASYDFSNGEAVKQAVLASKSIGYSTGPSGVHLAKLFETWGIADQIKDRIVQPAPGIPVGSLVAKGEVELGFQQLSELLGVEGITILGPLPADIQIMTTFAGGIASGTEHRKAAEELLRFITAPETALVKTRHGMENI